MIEVDESTVYRDLQKHLDSMPVGFPATESGVEIRILKRLFTPQEAVIAANLKFSWTPSETIDEIHQRLEPIGISREELEDSLDTMASKGLIFRKKGEHTAYYGNVQWVIGIYEFQVNKMTAELYSDIVDYNIEAFGRELFYSPQPQLRVIPVGKSVDHAHEIAAYDNIRELLTKATGPFMVANCICRQAMDAVDNPCKTTDRRETCIAIGDHAQMYIDEDWGREVTKEELLDILQQNEEDGLVLQPSNARSLDFICSCCGCCCGILFGSKMSRKPVKFYSTNHFAEVDSEFCTLCGICEEKCQMEAISLEGDTAVIDLNRCIGCGICVANCSSDALSLQQKEEVKVPPKTSEELYSTLLEKKQEHS